MLVWANLGTRGTAASKRLFFGGCACLNLGLPGPSKLIIVVLIIIIFSDIQLNLFIFYKYFASAQGLLLFVGLVDKMRKISFLSISQFMNPKTNFRIGILNQLRQENDTYRQQVQSLFKQSLGKSTQRRGDVPLVFLSTFMQTEQLHNYSQQPSANLQMQNLTEPLQQCSGTNKRYQRERDEAKRGELNKFYQTKMKQIQKDQRSVTALLGDLQQEKKPNRRLLSQISETFQRAKTFTTMPVVNKQGFSIRKKQQNSRRMECAFQQFVSKRSHTQNEECSHSKRYQVQTVISNKKVPQLKQTLNLSKFLKNEKVRGRKMLTEHAKADRQTYNQPISSAKDKKTKTTELKQFRWTQMGNKGLFNLKLNSQ